MTINFQIKALPFEEFAELKGKNEQELANAHAKWLTVDVEPGFPCRVSLMDAKIGERVLLLSYPYHNVKSAYKASGPIFVREHAIEGIWQVNEVPKMLRHRLQSVRAYDVENTMIGAETIHGEQLEIAINNQLKNRNTDYIHIHNANPGCFNCSVHRA